MPLPFKSVLLRAQASGGLAVEGEVVNWSGVDLGHDMTVSRLSDPGQTPRSGKDLIATAAEQ
jgi:hypothetical protein